MTALSVQAAPRRSLADAAALTWACRHRWVVLGTWTVLLALRRGHGNDWPLLAQAARRLTGADGLHLYARHPGLQIGAPGLLVVRALDLLGSPVPVQVVLALCAVAVLWLGERVGLAEGQQPSPLRTITTGLVAGAAWSSVAGDWLHVEDALALLCLSAAALLVRSASERDGLVAGVLLGLAIAVKPWAVVGLPLLLTRRHRGRVWAAAVAVPAACWAPFVLADRGTLAVTHAAFPVMTATPVHLLHLAAGASPAWIRSAQLGLAVLFALAAVRRQPGHVANVVAAGLVGRLLLDVADYPYYWAGLVLAVGYADVAAGRRPFRTAVAAVGWCLPMAGLHGPVVAAVRLTILVWLAAWLLSGKHPGDQRVRLSPRPATRASSS